MKAYCVRCRKNVVMKDPKEGQGKGCYHVGKCPGCRKLIYRFGK